MAAGLVDSYFPRVTVVSRCGDAIGGSAAFDVLFSSFVFRWYVPRRAPERTVARYAFYPDVVDCHLAIGWVAVSPSTINDGDACGEGSLLGYWKALRWREAFSYYYCHFRSLLFFVGITF